MIITSILQRKLSRGEMRKQGCPAEHVAGPGFAHPGQIDPEPATVCWCFSSPQKGVRWRSGCPGMDIMTARTGENGTEMTDGARGGDRRWSGTWSLSGEALGPPGKAPWPGDWVILVPICPLLWICALALPLSGWSWANHSGSLSLNCFIYKIGMI